MTDDIYYSERQSGEVERENKDISENFWGGFVAIIEPRSRVGWWAERYPTHCIEASLPVETDQEALGRAFNAHNQRVPWPLEPENVPVTLDALDAIEFFGRNVSKPKRKEYHEGGRHHHIISFDRDQGFEEYRTEINTMLRRCRHPYELNTEGQIQRLGPPVLRESLSSVVFSSSDTELNKLLETARQKFQNPAPDVREEALKTLWDAWERLKTIPPGDKKTSVKALLDAAVAEPTFRTLVEKEALELTSIGNNFMIRHSETNKVRITESEHVDYLFHRMFALILMILRMWPRSSV